MRPITSLIALFLFILLVTANVFQDISTHPKTKALEKRYLNKNTKRAASPENTQINSTASSTDIRTIINIKSTCGDIRATSMSWATSLLHPVPDLLSTEEVTALSGPNGHIDWLNCGFEIDGGWQPPYIRMEDIITHSLPSALKKSSSPFKACSEYISIFEKYGGEYNIPPILLASFAMQESSCEPDTVGGGGEQGLMQITPDKCVGAPNPGGCRDPVRHFQQPHFWKWRSRLMSVSGI